MLQDRKLIDTGFTFNWNEGKLRYKKKDIFGIYVNPNDKQSSIAALGLREKFFLHKTPLYYYNEKNGLCKRVSSASLTKKWNLRPSEPSHYQQTLPKSRNYTKAIQHIAYEKPYSNTSIASASGSRGTKLIKSQQDKPKLINTSEKSITSATTSMSATNKHKSAADLMMNTGATGGTIALTSTQSNSKMSNFYQKNPNASHYVQPLPNLSKQQVADGRSAYPIFSTTVASVGALGSDDIASNKSHRGKFTTTPAISTANNSAVKPNTAVTISNPEFYNTFATNESSRSLQYQCTPTQQFTNSYDHRAAVRDTVGYGQVQPLYRRY